jgi:hypothetical protein
MPFSPPVWPMEKRSAFDRWIMTALNYVEAVQADRDHMIKHGKPSDKRIKDLEAARFAMTAMFDEVWEREPK